MRHKLIEWLIDDIAPRVRRSGDAEGELLKFATEQNLSPALLEGLGQLFNTAKTISYMDKSASRGDSFPTVDVQKLVSQYLEVPASKLASDPDGWLQADAKLAPKPNMPDFFALPETDGLEFTVDKAASTRPESLGPIRANIATARMVRTDLEEDSRLLLDRMVKSARRGNLNWELLELDSMALLGDGAKLALDNAAEYLAAHNCMVKRATWDGKPRFIESPVVEIEFLAKSLAGIKEATLLIQEMDAELTKASGALAGKEETDPSKAPAPQPGKGRASNIPGDLSSFAPGSLSFDSSKSPLKTGPDALFNLLAPARDQLVKTFHKHLSTSHDAGAESAAAMNDTHHLALLQNLLTTDDVLSEADPDLVASAYNTIRATAPNLASDINVMRVALRSAVQHEGIDPFTIKGLAETEAARQKVHTPNKPKPEKE